MANKKNTIVFTGKAKDLNDTFYLILNDIVNTYPRSKLNPTSANNALFDGHMTQMLNLQNQYFLFKNDVIGATETIQKDIKAADDKINIIEGQNKVLAMQFENLKNSSYSAEGLFDDAQITRNELLVSNFILLGAICCGGFMYYKTL